MPIKPEERRVTLVFPEYEDGSYEYPVVVSSEFVTFRAGDPWYSIHIPRELWPQVVTEINRLAEMQQTPAEPA